MHIYKDILKYGHSKFTVEILEYYDPSELLKRKQYYFDLLKPKYSILKFAGYPLGYKHTQEAIEKLKNLGTGRKLSDQAKVRAARLGSIILKETRLKISSSKLKANFKHSESGKLKIGKSALARLGRVT